MLLIKADLNYNITLYIIEIILIRYQVNTVI